MSKPVETILPLSRMLRDGVLVNQLLFTGLRPCKYGAECGEYGCMAATVFNNTLHNGGGGVDEKLRAVIKEWNCRHLNQAIVVARRAWERAGGKTLEELEVELELLNMEWKLLSGSSYSAEKKRNSNARGALRVAINRAQRGRE